MCACMHMSNVLHHYISLLWSSLFCVHTTNKGSIRSSVRFNGKNSAHYYAILSVKTLDTATELESPYSMLMGAIHCLKPEVDPTGRISPSFIFSIPFESTPGFNPKNCIKNCKNMLYI